MRKLIFHRLLYILVVSVFIAITAQKSVANDSLESQVTDILSEEAMKGKIKVGISEFSVSTNREVSPSDIENLKTQAKEEFMAGLLQNLKAKGVKDKVSLLSESAVDVDIKILGSIRLTENEAVYSAKVVKAKSGEILGIAKQTEDISGGILGQIANSLVKTVMDSNEAAPAPAPAQPQRLLDESFTVYASTHKSYSWKFNAPIALDINLSSNSNVSIFIMDETSYWKYKAGESVYPVASKNDVLSASFEAQIPQAGTYYIVISNRAILTPANVSIQVYIRP